MTLARQQFVGILLLLTISRTFVFSECGLFKLQAEAFKGNGKIVKSIRAYGGKAVHLGVGQKHKMFFCLQKETDVTLQHIRYLNQGKPKSVSVHLDGTYLDLLRTTNETSCNHHQSMSITSKGVSEPVKLSRGRHVLRVQVNSGSRYGLDIDAVTLAIDDPDLRWETFRCKTFCNSEIPFGPSTDSVVKDYVSPAKAVQKSYKTQCAEVDNVKILLFHENIKKYTIKARNPSYRTLANFREPDFSQCSFSANLVWEVSGIKFYKRNFKHVDKTVRLQIEHKRQFRIEMTAEFKVKGRAEGMNDHDIGNILSVDVRNVMARTVVRVVIYGRQGKWKTIGTKNVTTAKTRNLQWNIPDYSWREDEENILKVIFTGSRLVRAEIAKIKLEKRGMKRDWSFSMFNDGNTIVEGVEVDMWWLKNTITISVEGESRTWKVHYFRLYFPVPWTDGFSQVFVMYQDGNVRLLPCSPHGTDWIPFGSSVLIGQVNTSDHRPAAEIVRVHINPDSQEMTVFYADSGVVLITLEVTMDDTIAHVNVLHLGRDSMIFPFVSFRSMWVKDGNSDVDHVSSNGLHGHHILDPWSILYGYSFTFYRQCISKHNTQSPDINIEIVQ